MWKINQVVYGQTTGGTAQTLQELLDNLEERNLITKEERETIEKTGKVTIGSKTIDFGKEGEQPVPKDEIAPNEAQIEIAESIIIGENIQATVVQTDNDGIDYNASKWVYSEEKNPLGTKNDDVTKYIGGNFESDDGQQTQITIHVDKIGEYYLHVLSVDKEGNKTETISHKVIVQTEKEAKINMIGRYVDFGIDLNGKNGTTDDWRVFYVGGINDDDPQEAKDRIYIIAADYVPNTNATMQEVISKGAIEQRMTEGYHTYYWSTESKIPPFNYVDTKKEGQNIFLELFMGTGYYCSKHTENPNSKAVGALQNTINWQPFIDNSTKASLADKAIGGPTGEMWVKSWNAKHGKNSKDENKQEVYIKGESSGSEIGYNFDTDESMSSSDYIVDLSSTTGYNDTLYFSHKNAFGIGITIDDQGENDDLCYHYWLASPSGYNRLSLMIVGSGGKIASHHTTSGEAGLRPLIVLKSNHYLKETGTIVNGEKLYDIM